MKPISVLLVLPLAAACASGASRMAPEPAPTPRTTMGTPGIDRIEERDGREAAQFQQCMTSKGYAAKR